MAGLKYAYSVVKATIEYICHRNGFICSLKYKKPVFSTDNNKAMVVGTTHYESLKYLRGKSFLNILNIGDSQGSLSEKLLNDGVELTSVGIESGRSEFSNLFKKDQSGPHTSNSIFDYDAVLLLDVIEQLASPETLLLDLRNTQFYGNKPRQPIVLISTPNIAFITLRFTHLLGVFNYSERGVLNIRHNRLFTLSSLRAILDDCGYEIIETIPIGIPFGLVSNGFLGRALAKLSTLFAKLWPRGFAFQFLMVELLRNVVES